MVFFFLVGLCFIRILYLFRKWLTSGRTMGSSKAWMGSALITKSYSCVSRGIAVIRHVFEVKAFIAFCLNQWPVSFLRTIQRNSDRPPMPDEFFLFNSLKGILKKSIIKSSNQWVKPDDESQHYNIDLKQYQTTKLYKAVYSRKLTKLLIPLQMTNLITLGFCVF